ncbi:hypothetical protein F511_40525 [Dorcoceras hygrometricum]|uniref:Uncharacterized protein n=1 Tax=Dorcoceras hygrometricum TaxID=472368 RepID=A0A2Z7BE72_9LAMI|nr:hypothetical protein F511_40525 [Dorcoceras hygrometricum]
MISRTHIKYVKQYSADAVDDINLKFAEAREEIESAMESKETVYFNEEAECARRAVGEVLDMYEGLLRKLIDYFFETESEIFLHFPFLFNRICNCVEV